MNNDVGRDYDSPEGDQFDGRTVGQFPLSIATSLALEGLFGILEDSPNPNNPPYKHFGYLLINFRTLFRNLLGALDTVTRNGITIKDCVSLMIEEMRIIQSVVKQHSKGSMSVAFYACSYKDLTGFYPYSLFKEVKSVKQKEYAHLENETFNHVYKTLGGIANGMLTSYDTTILSIAKNTLMMTHYPIDLLNVKGALSLGLLESHTGVVKSKAEWGTKLQNHKDHPRIPFDRMTVQVFGDSGGLFKPYPLEHRQRLIELSEKYEWNGTTTKDRILQCVEQSHNPMLLAEIRKLYFI